MPELPEVETIVRQLKHKLVGKEIIKVDIFDKLIDSKIKNIIPVKITDVQRRAKYIIIHLNNNLFFLVHLGMTGLFYYVEKDKLHSMKEIYSKYIVAMFYFQDGSILTHNSMRKFGRFELINKEKLINLFSSLGPEPLQKEFTLDKFRDLLFTRKNANLKVTLMDLHFISGIGNIYAQEALYYAGIDPHRKIGTLTISEIKKLYESIIKVLNEGIEHKGTSVDNYIHLEGDGSYQNHLVVYQKKYCPKKHTLKRIVLGGRGTTYCPICQK